MVGGPIPAAMVIASAIASSSSCLLRRCQYSAGDWTPSSAASRRTVNPSSPTWSSSPRAVWMIVWRVRTARLYSRIA